MNSMTQLLEIMAALRDPVTGCPWDREQDFSSIAPYTLEEAYEVVDAIERNDMKELCAELGDLLFQVVYHARLAEERGEFGFGEVVAGISNKLIKRHPHVFGGASIADAHAQSLAWEQTKMQERSDDPAGRTQGLLAGITPSLPALRRAQKLQVRAAMAGFDWDTCFAVIAKLNEELEELRAELTEQPDKDALEDELGDVLFSSVNLARHLHIDAETALRHANNKFQRRFSYIEQSLQARGLSLEQAGMEEMDRLWEEAKLNSDNG